jgi:2-methylfumaryl-CoA isomerase
VTITGSEPAPTENPACLPLSGMRVIEVSSFVAAPLAGMTLAQLGADVIRVDPRGGAGDRFRWPLAESGASLYWAGLNKGKRSLTVDFRTHDGRTVVGDLLRSCPTGSAVVITNSVGRRWLSYEGLVEFAPDLIHVQVEGKSDGSPAVDYTVNAATGFPLITGPIGFADPVNHVLPAWDLACGLYSAVAVCAAAMRRKATGAGESIRLALADVALATTGNLGFIAEAQLNGTERRRIGNHLYGGFARDFECQDGRRIMLVALTDRQWRELVDVTQTGPAVAALEDVLGADFALETQRYEHREVLAALMARWFARRSAAQAAAALESTSVLWAEYRTFSEVVADLRADGPDSLFSSVDQPGIGPYLTPRSPIRIASQSLPCAPAPTIGQHSLEILRELGRTDEEIAQLAPDGLVREGQNP